MLRVSSLSSGRLLSALTVSTCTNTLQCGVATAATQHRYEHSHPRFISSSLSQHTIDTYDLANKITSNTATRTSSTPVSLGMRAAVDEDFHSMAVFKKKVNITSVQELHNLRIGTGACDIQKESKRPRQMRYNMLRSVIGLSSGQQQHRPVNHCQNASQARSFSSSTSSATTSTSAVPKQKQRIAVIGAGVAGLQTVRALLHRDDPSGRDDGALELDVTAFESAATVGGLWKENYANFGVQVPRQLYEFQDYPMESVPMGEFATGPQVQDYIESYADTFGLRDSIQFNTKVTSAIQTEKDGNKIWKVQTEGSCGKQETQEFDYLVMSTGLYSRAKKSVPSKAGQDTFGGEVYHSSDFTDASVAKNKSVVVVGSGKSAIDCAIASCKAGATSVTLLQRTAHWPTPRKIAGLIPFQHIFLSRLGTAMISAHTGTFPGSGMAVNAFRNSVIGPFLMRPLFGLLEELFAFQFGLRGDLRPKADVVSDFYDVALVLSSEIKDLKEAGKIDVQLGEIAEYESDDSAVLLKNGSSVDADLVVWATGFAQDYSIFSDPATRRDLDLESDGMYLYRYILPEKVEKLAFIGHVGAISNISAYGLQAEWLARNITGNLVSGGSATTDKESMRDEIEARKSWARSWIPKSANRGMQVLLHQTHYNDQLLRDMGLNPHRKTNLLSEYFMPYQPADYDGIVGGFQRTTTQVPI